MSDKETVTIELRPRQHAYLREMARKHGLDDAAKAVRVLVDYAIDETGREHEIFVERRCLDC